MCIRDRLESVVFNDIVVRKQYGNIVDCLDQNNTVGIKQISIWASHCSETVSYTHLSDSLLQALLEKNTQDLAEIQLKPYTPTVYAIPDTIWTAMVNLLQNAVTFQPTPVSYTHLDVYKRQK